MVEVSYGIEEETKSDKDLHLELKIGDRYKLECGHEGRVVWVSNDYKTIGVAGVRRSCSVCGKKSTGNWSPNVYLIAMDKSE